MAALWLAAVMTASATGGAAAQQNDKAPRVAADSASQPWIVSCSNRGTPGKLNCVMEQTLVAESTRQKILHVSVSRGAKAGAFGMRINMPHGIHLPSGVVLFVDEGQKAGFPVETADQNGSYLTVPLDAGLTAALKAGKIMSIAARTASQDDITFQVTLEGFSTAFALLAAE